MEEDMSNDGKFWIGPKTVTTVRTKADGTTYTTEFVREGHWRRRRGDNQVPSPSDAIPGVLVAPDPIMPVAPAPAVSHFTPEFIIQHGPVDKATRVYFNPAHVMSITEGLRPDATSVTLTSGEVIEVKETFDSSVKKLFGGS